MDNRRTERHEVRLAAEVHTGSTIIVAGTENLSDEGVCLSMGLELAENEVVGVSMFRVDDGIEDPDAEPINVAARVIWCETRPGPQIVAGMSFLEPLRSI